VRRLKPCYLLHERLVVPATTTCHPQWHLWLNGFCGRRAVAVAGTWRLSGVRSILSLAQKWAVVRMYRAPATSRCRRQPRLGRCIHVGSVIRAPQHAAGALAGMNASSDYLPLSGCSSVTLRGRSVGGTAPKSICAVRGNEHLSFFAFTVGRRHGSGRVWIPRQQGEAICSVIHAVPSELWEIRG